MIGDRLFLEQFHVVDPNFFQIIKLPLVEGDPPRCSPRPDSVVLSQDRARKYFGDAEPLGKTITLSENRCDDLGDKLPCQPACPEGHRGDARPAAQLLILLLDGLFPITSNADPHAAVEEGQAWFNYAWLGLCAACAGRRSRMRDGQDEVRSSDRSADPKLHVGVHMPRQRLSSILTWLRSRICI